MNLQGFRRPLTTLLAAASVFLVPGTPRAETWPAKPVTLVVASLPGGILDTVGRIVAHGMEKMGQPVVVQNLPGAGSSLGTAAVARAAPDGYTLGMVATSHAINPSIYKRLPYDTQRDLVPISHAVNLINVLVVSPNTPVSTLKEFIALAKRKPGDLTYGSAGNGQSNHLSAEMLKSGAGIKLTHVPYKGSAAAIADVQAGMINCMFVDVLSAMPLIKAGKLKAIAVTSTARVPTAPDIPTFAESGMPEFQGASWLGVIGNAGMPRALVDKISANVAQTMRDPAVRQRLVSMGVEPVGSTPEQFAKFLDSETARYAAAVKTAGVALD